MQGKAWESEQILRALQRFDELRQTTSLEETQRLRVALSELQETLEELQTADEELRQQNEELLEARQAVEEQRRHYLELFELAPEAYLETDLDGVIHEANRAASALLRVAPGFLTGKPLTVFVAEEHRRLFRGWLLRLAQLERPQDWEVLLQPRGAPKFPAGVTAAAVRERHGTAVGVRWLLHDRTRHRQAEDELRRAHDELEQRVQQRTAELERANAALRLEMAERQRTEEERLQLELRLRHAQKLESLGVLAGGIAHDFNNLLMSVLCYADLALMDLEPDAAPRRSLTQIQVAAQRATELTTQMLAYSGKGRFVIQAIDLSVSIETSAPLLEPLVARDVTLEYRLQRGLPLVEADPSQILQVLLNLVTNASEACVDGGGSITVSTGVVEADRAYLGQTYVGDGLPAGAYVYLEVCDTGHGMDAATQARIFEPFFTTKFIGRGLGLASVVGILRGHRGTIGVQSLPGQGSTFRVLFPSAAASSEGTAPAAPRSDVELAAPPSAASRGAGAVTILVVDDERLVRDATRTMLEKFGYRVLTACDGAEGVELYRQHCDSVAAVLLDMTMPRMDGEEALREIRRLQPDARVILSSGYTEQDIAGRFAGKGRSASFSAFLQKPYGPLKLLETVRDVLEA